MKTYTFRDAPLYVFGAPLFQKTGIFHRLPEDVVKQLPPCYTEWIISRRVPGARLCFRTDAQEITLRISYETMSLDLGMSMYAAQGANVFVGPRKEMRYLGVVAPQNYDVREATGTFNKKNADMEDVTIYLPRNEVLTNVEVILPDDARVEAPTPYTHSTPILFYGNSVTEGGCCSKPSLAYTALVSRWLDSDFINFGFSGAANGELAMADHINTIDKSVLVMDYDYNAPDAEHLRRTHAPFFRRIREKNPTLPVIFMSASNVGWCPDDVERREVILETYNAARAAGDENVYFINGADLWRPGDPADCNSDCCHPHDLGMFRTAQVLYPVLDKILNK